MTEKIDILIVDDRPENLLSLESMLEAPDLNFVRALSGEEALEATLRTSPALIILDVQMPGMNGFEVARLLRGMERTRGIPIIFVTATHREEKFSFEGFESGAVDYLFKPLNAVVVRSKIRVFVELHRKSIRLERAVRDLSFINQELESFSYSVSHDLRAPVRTVIGFSEHLLASCDPADAERLGDLRRVKDAALRMNGLIDALLDLSRIGRAEPARQDVDLSAMASQICADLRRDLPPARPVEIDVTPGIIATGDRRLLDAALRNLLTNAFKFTSKAPVALVQFGSKTVAGETVYFVRDNGAGFDMTYADRLFAPFQRLHTQDDFAGTGIGLATVRRVVHRHGGRIWAEGAVGQGATFLFTLG